MIYEIINKLYMLSGNLQQYPCGLDNHRAGPCTKSTTASHNFCKPS